MPDGTAVDVDAQRVRHVEQILQDTLGNTLGTPETEG
jgi:hypothetical protein